ncbi:MAG: abortive infection system antitoxin AbiGi family protein, partial [Bacteroidales bacterium]|nr:abortive infection system antitoxin AbiGi family protein [Bacteroidales bacterium]
MAISSNSIIHYTKELTRLESIIKSKGFRICYCSEKVNTRGGKSYSFAIPMVSFCDIPIVEYKKHFYHTKGKKLGYYGDYGIGLNKSWATKNGLYPVVYIDYNSFTGTGLRK